MNKVNRYISIDLIRGFSILLIMLIHSTVYFLGDKNVYVLWDLSHFAVPLFVFCSGYVLFSKYKNAMSLKDALQFYQKRIIRLVVPYYVYLIFHFILRYLENTDRVNVGSILEAVFLLGRPDISWLVVLFLQLMLVFPLLVYAARKTFIIALILMAVFAFSFSLIFIKPAMNDRYYMFIPWILPLLLPLMYQRIENNKLKRTLMLIFSFLLFLGLRFIISSGDHSLVLQYNKYPPNLYYLSYGIFWIFVLGLVFQISLFTQSFIKRTLQFYSVHSYTLFFVHYLLLQVVFNLFKKPPFTWYTLFIFLVISSTIIAFILAKLDIKKILRSK